MHQNDNQLYHTFIMYYANEENANSSKNVFRQDYEATQKITRLNLNIS